jgi:hypothetical protein
VLAVKRLLFTSKFLFFRSFKRDFHISALIT